MSGPAGDPSPSIETRASWVIAITVVTILSVSFGAPLLVVVALRPIAADLGGARSIPALASSLAYFGAGAGGMLMGWLAGRTSTRLTSMIGGSMLGCGLLLASGGAAWQLIAGFGLLVGVLGNGALYPPMMTYVSLWFDRRRGTALALVSSGQYVAGAVWPTVFERAIAAYGWQRAMLGYGLFAAGVILPLAALVLRPPPGFRRALRPWRGRWPARGFSDCGPIWRSACSPSPPSYAASRWRCRRRIWWPSAATSGSPGRGVRPCFPCCSPWPSSPASSGAGSRTASAG